MTVATRDLLTENSMCWRAGFIGQAYSSATAIPLRVTSQASVWVFARTSPTVDQESSAACHFSVSTARDRKSFSAVTYSRTGPIPRGMPLVGKISSIRVSAKAKYSGHFHESRSIRSRIASEGSTMTSSLAEVSSPTCGSLGSSGPLCVFAFGSAPEATAMPFALPEAAPIRRLGSTAGPGGTSSSPAISPPLSRCARVCWFDVQGTDYPDREKRSRWARPNVLDPPSPRQRQSAQSSGQPTVERRDHGARAVVSALHHGFGGSRRLGPCASWTGRGLKPALDPRRRGWLGLGSRRRAW